MDKQSNSTPVPEISTLIMGTGASELLHRLTVEDLRELSMKELRALLALFIALDETAGAFLNQERYTNGRVFNAAGDLGNGLGEHLSWCISMIEQVAKDAAPTTAEEAQHRAWLLLQRAAHYSDDLPRFLVSAAQLSVSVSDMEGV